MGAKVKRVPAQTPIGRAARHAAGADLGLHAERTPMAYFRHAAARRRMVAVPSPRMESGSATQQTGLSSLEERLVGPTEILAFGTVLAFVALALFGRRFGSPTKTCRG